MTFAPAQMLFAVLDRIDYFFRDNVGRDLLNVIDLTVASGTFDHENINKATGDIYEPSTVQLAVSYRYRPAECIFCIQQLVSPTAQELVIIEYKY
jgi:hypothetical protein